MEDLTIGYGYVPNWFMIVALVVSIYHGYKGYTLQRWTVQTQRLVEEQRATRDNPTFYWFMPPIETIAVRHIPMYYALHYFFCSLFGFVALWLVICRFFITPEVLDTSGGLCLLIFLIVLSIVGISGVLPFVIRLVKMLR